MATKKDKSEGFTAETFSSLKTPDYVVIELRYNSQLAAAPSGVFEAPTTKQKDAHSLNTVLGNFKLKSVSSHFGMSAKMMSVRATNAPRSLNVKVSAEFAQAGFIRVVPKNSKDCEKLTMKLEKAKSVWKAYVAPKPVPAAMATGASKATRNFEPAQGYLHSAPNGIGAMEVWSLAGAKGKGITICDIEGNWNLKHEDLPKGISHIGGTLIPSIGWKNHGTAVLGEMIRRPGDGGTVGISHQAKGVVQSAVIGGVFNTAGAIMNATKHLKAGDVILIELQATGPNGKYVAMQYWDDIFSAIRVATQKGITVVEAAGNGNENFDLPIFTGTGLQKDSGAIVVGAGIPPTNWFDNFGAGSSLPGYSQIGVPQSRIWFSNFGKIVNVQGWGWHVTTLGYGDAQGGSNQNKWYTHRFSGTSSASPIVTGAVACLQGRAKAKRRRPLTPAKVRRILMRTGRSQKAGPGVPKSQRIGPLPNLPRAMKKV